MMETISVLLVPCGIYCIILAGLWGSLGFLALSEKVRDPKHEPWSGVLARAFWVSVGATLVSTQLGSYHPGGGLCVGCGGDGGIVRGYPFPWWGMEATGILMVAMPLFLALDLWFWLILGFVLLFPLRWASPKLIRPTVSSALMVLVGGVLVFSPLFIPYLNSNVEMAAAIQARRDQVKKERQAGYDERIRRIAPLANASLEFIGCREKLVPSTQHSGIKNLNVEIMFQVNHAGSYRFLATSRGFFGQEVVQRKLDVGTQTIEFQFEPNVVPVGAQRETQLAWDGPYTVEVNLDSIDRINEESFGQSDRRRAQELGILDGSKFKLTCKTGPYKITEFGPPYGTFPRTPIPTLTR